MYDRNGKSERIPTKLHADVPEYICKRTIKFRLENLSDFILSELAYSSSNIDDKIHLFPAQRYLLQSISAPAHSAAVD